MVAGAALTTKYRSSVIPVVMLISLFRVLPLTARQERSTLFISQTTTRNAPNPITPAETYLSEAGELETFFLSRDPFA